MGLHTTTSSHAVISNTKLDIDESKSDQRLNWMNPKFSSLFAVSSEKAFTQKDMVSLANCKKDRGSDQLYGEHLKIYQEIGLNSVKWQSSSEPPKDQSLTWYKAIVDPPSGDEPIGLDMIDMGKGLAWLNGQEIGRYWPRRSSIHEECPANAILRRKI
ncbi:hypothetical protein IFM89_006278 [Coptis chinensis]|uniref:Beta-galactosidase galactose-binding domain-containing protein n=1 Tax=Coptis chinensis TaxID=261450 RepID=A0A835GZE3_9MAGN|nr:hypothetical protein IFM89_006278 [Coptis chinensis]